MQHPDSSIFIGGLRLDFKGISAGLLRIHRARSLIG